MSSTVQHKLLGVEYPPPEGLWQKIVSELDDSASGYSFPSRLREMTIPPPLHCWNNISTQLDMEMTADDMAAKLYAAEAVPPAAAWEKIRASLDVETAIPERRRIAPVLRYAAAAAIIGFLAFGAIRLLNTGNEVPEIVTQKTTAEKTTADIPGITDNDLPERVTEVNATAADNEEARNDAALEESKKTFAKLDIASRKRAVAASQFSFSNYIPSEVLSEHGSSGYEEGLSPEPDQANRYIVLMTPDGHFIRMSKKLSDLVCCVSGEEEDENCRLQMKKWRKQLAGTGVSHPGNFMDILNLVGSLRDN